MEHLRTSFCSCRLVVQRALTRLLTFRHSTWLIIQHILSSHVLTHTPLSKDSVGNVVTSLTPTNMSWVTVYQPQPPLVAIGVLTREAVTFVPVLVLVLLDIALTLVWWTISWVLKKKPTASVSGLSTGNGGLTTSAHG